MTRLPSYLAYHTESARIGDIDPSHALLRYVCDRYELNIEQRYWLAFLYAMTYCGASVFYAYNEFPDYENVDIGRMNRWWFGRGREAIICQTDRRWVRSSSLFVPAVQSYQKWLNRKTQHEHFCTMIAGRETPEARYDKIYACAKSLYTFGQFTLFLYLEALDTITPLGLVPTDLDLSAAWSCRNGLCYAYGLDHYITDEGQPTPKEGKDEIMASWNDLKLRLSQLPSPPNVWNTETILCAYKKWHRGKRYIGYYLDRQAIEIAKMADHVRNGVCWDVLWQFRSETFVHDHLAEKHDGVTAKGIKPKWKTMSEDRTNQIAAI